MTDWNGNGREDAGDWYIDYEIMNDDGGGGSSDGSGCGCLLLIFAALVFISLF